MNGPSTPSHFSHDQRSASAYWLGLGLALAYLAVMAAMMWLYESALALETVTALVGDPRRLNLWLLIVLSSVLVFLLSAWALRRIVRQSAVHGRSAAGPGQAQPDLSARSAGWFLLGLALLLLASGGYVLREQEAAVRAAQFRQIAVVARVKTDLASRWVAERHRDLQALVENQDFVNNLERLVAAKQGRPHQATRATQATATTSSLPAVQAMIRAKGFVGALILDAQGRTIYRMPDDLVVAAQCQDWARLGSAAAGTSIQMARVFAADNQDPSVDLMALITADAGNNKRRQVATVCVRIDLVARLLPSLGVWPMPTRTGEILLARRDGEHVTVLQAPRAGAEHQALAVLTDARARWETTLAATRAGELHERELADGRTLLRAAYEVEGAPWMVLARMDAEEADQLQSHAQRRVAVLAGFGFVFAVAVGMLGWARNSARASRFEHDREELISKLQDMAYHDAVTGLPRRALTLDRLQMAMAQAQRVQGSVGLLFIDLDGFKRINDEHGHAAGDAILRGVAERLGASLRGSDTAGRYGGDEFVVVLPGCSDAQALAQLGDRFHAATTTPLKWQDQVLKVGASLGGALYPLHAADSHGLVDAADKAMYRAKQSGGGYFAA